jgi:hypothetical protein
MRRLSLGAPLVSLMAQMEQMDGLHATGMNSVLQRAIVPHASRR